ncbi:hypothetical protein [Altererythrobacter ishigakiensis]|uniref:Uncharacterized protein n=1 Tax=Altererythrobacter ishigakiensis TaxID=476157 RepID=A0A562UTH9_9SPHN|nr:hypothetical protein [Altererythrobacter ishigakiensis]TWJ08911.1 hypothetical protein JN10_0531 [Altererythrobacter ishigakiensis]
MTSLIHPALIAAASLGLLAAPALANAQGQAKDTPVEQTKGEKKLAKILEGRVAGEARSCIYTRPSESMRIIDDTAIVYGRGKTIYVNRTAHPEDLDDRDIMVVRRFSGSQLCRQDIVTTIDPGSRTFSGSIFLSEFIPYTRVESDPAAEGN